MPSTDPRYLAATLDEMYAEYFADKFYNDPKAIENETEDPDFDPDEVANIIGAGGDMETISGE